MKPLSPSLSLCKARLHHRYLMRTVAGLAPAIAGAGMVLPGGEVSLPLVDHKVAVYRVTPFIGHHCICVALEDGQKTIDRALDQLSGFDRCVRAAQAKADLAYPPIAAQ